MFRRLCLLAVLGGCVPKTVELAPFTGEDGLHSTFPVDARPAPERRPGGFHVSQAPVPQLNWGDFNLRPGVLPLVDSTVRAGLAELEGDIEVDVWVLHHVVRRDRSDAHWVSTATGGIAGTVSKLVYPDFFEADVHLRLQFRRGDDIVLVRDLQAVGVRSLAVARTWGFWHLYRRSPSGEQVTALLQDVYGRLSADVHTLATDVLAGRPPTVGRPPESFAQHALAPRWEGFDSVQSATDRSPLLAAKYPSPTFSVVSGFEHRKGAVVGRLGLPLDTLGYDIGWSDDVQVLVDITVLGLYNSATVGLRWRVLEAGRSSLAVEGRVGGYLAFDLQPVNAVFAGTNASLAAVFAHRPRTTTFFFRISPNMLTVREPIDAFAELDAGSVAGVTLAPGIETPLSATTTVAFQLALVSEFQGGETLTSGIGPFLPVPVVTLGFR